VLIVGGGIAGLTAAQRLRELSPSADLIVLERSDRLGGKIQPRRPAAAVETAPDLLVLEQGRPPPLRWRTASGSAPIWCIRPRCRPR
jgi:cation diffusion facilitator CzcD-associated flavoprotein CzcO